jgi:DNA-binding transcriptional LysR family regulator
LRHIDFKALDVFLQVMRHGSIGSAAAALGMRAPTVVYAIRKLREVTGDELFLERRGNLVPTARGLKLEKAASGMLQSWHGLIEHNRQAPRLAGPRQTMRIGLSMALGDPALTQILARLSAALPERQIVSSVLDNGRQAGQALRKGLIDCAVTVDGVVSLDGVASEHILTAQRCMIGLPVADTGSGDGQGQHWTLLSDDADTDSAVRRYLALADAAAGVRLTVAPSWNGQLALWRSRGGLTPVLKFNVPWIDGASAAYVTDVPPGFPAWANLSLFYMAGSADTPWLGTVRRELLTVLRGIAAATMPPPAAMPSPANDEPLPLLRAG